MSNEGAKSSASFDLIKFDLIFGAMSNLASFYNPPRCRKKKKTNRFRWFIAFRPAETLFPPRYDLINFTFAFPLTTGFALETNKFLMTRFDGKVNKIESTIV